MVLGSGSEGVHLLGIQIDGEKLIFKRNSH